jgi:putative endonuclease
MNENISETAPHTRQKGQIGEDMAAEFLLSQGWEIITRNYQARRGEIDCIAKDPKGTLVFVEVKYAQSMSRGHPAFWVTRGKQNKLAQMARLYCAEHHIVNQPCRFDVIAIVNDKIEHIKNAFLS